MDLRVVRVAHILVVRFGSRGIVGSMSGCDASCRFTLSTMTVTDRRGEEKEQGFNALEFRSIGSRLVVQILHFAVRCVHRGFKTSVRR